MLTTILRLLNLVNLVLFVSNKEDGNTILEVLGQVDFQILEPCVCIEQALLVCDVIHIDDSISSTVELLCHQINNILTW